MKAGARLAEVHVHYEKQAEYPLTKTEKAGEKLDWPGVDLRGSMRWDSKSALFLAAFTRPLGMAARIVRAMICCG